MIYEMDTHFNYALEQSTTCTTKHNLYNKAQLVQQSTTCTTKHNLYKQVAMIYEMDTEATFDSRLYHKTYRYSRKAARGEKADRTAPLPMSLLQLIQRLRILSIDRTVKINCSYFATYQWKKMIRE